MKPGTELVHMLAQHVIQAAKGKASSHEIVHVMREGSDKVIEVGVFFIIDPLLTKNIEALITRHLGKPKEIPEDELGQP